MSADEQPQGLNGIDLIIDGKQLNGLDGGNDFYWLQSSNAGTFLYSNIIYVFGFAGVDESSLCAASRLAEDKTWLFEIELLQCNRCSTIFT